MNYEYSIIVLEGRLELLKRLDSDLELMCAREDLEEAIEVLKGRQEC